MAKTTTTAAPKKKPPAPPKKKVPTTGKTGHAGTVSGAAARSSGARIAGEGEETELGPTQASIEAFILALRRGGTAAPGAPEFGAAPVRVGYGRAPGMAGRFGSLGRYPKVLTVNDALARLATMAANDKEALVTLQYQLLNGGFYREGYYSKTNPDRVIEGQLDEDTREAMRTLLEQAVITPNRSLPEILSERAQARAKAGLVGPGAATGGVGGGADYRVTLSDPAALRTLADTIGVSLLGRKPTDQEKARLVAHIQGAEAAQDNALNTAAEAQRRTLYGAAETVAAGAGGGSIISPVEGGGTFSDTMGAPRDGGARSHKGTDIFGPKGSAAVAPIGGTVTKVGSSGKGGKRVWVRGDDGRFHYMAHLDSIAVKAGQRVEQGTPIGTVGNTGNATSTAPHVHYSINSSDSGEDAIGNPALEIKGAPPGAAKAAAGGYIAPVTTTTTKVSPEARIEEELRRANPAEAGAHDVANTFATFISLIGGSS